MPPLPNKQGSLEEGPLFVSAIESGAGSAKPDQSEADAVGRHN